MKMFRIDGYPLGPVQTNCYFLYDSETKDCLIVDPGEEGDVIIQRVREKGLKPHAILLTHAHFDHIGAVDDVRDAFHIPVYQHVEEKEWLQNPELNGSAKYFQLPDVAGRPADHYIEEEGTYTVGPFTFEVFHTPGHSPGSVTYYFEPFKTALVGDVIFRQSIGRTDLIGGSLETLLLSIKNRILTLPEDTVLYPGHGGATTPAAEKVDNPFIREYL